MTGRSPLIAVVIAVVLSLVLAAAVSAMPVRAPRTGDPSPRALSMGHSAASNGTAIAAPAAGSTSPDSDGLSTLAIVLIAAAAGAVAAGSLGAVAGRHSRAGIPGT